MNFMDFLLNVNSLASQLAFIYRRGNGDHILTELVDEDALDAAFFAKV
jgi:hypothetical protein